jgi:CDGSH-type Zn-finger protein
MQCPTGALQFERSDGGPPEPVPGHKTGTVVPDGPLSRRGDIEMTNPDGEIGLEDIRVALCRCGGSENKPFCGAHTEIGCSDDG